MLVLARIPGRAPGRHQCLQRVIWGHRTAPRLMSAKGHKRTFSRPTHHRQAETEARPSPEAYCETGAPAALGGASAHRACCPGGGGVVSEEGRLKGSSGVVHQFDEGPLIAISGRWSGRGAMSAHSQNRKCRDLTIRWRPSSVHRCAEQVQMSGVRRQEACGHVDRPESPIRFAGP